MEARKSKSTPAGSTGSPTKVNGKRQSLAQSKSSLALVSDSRGAELAALSPLSPKPSPQRRATVALEPLRKFTQAAVLSTRELLASRGWNLKALPDHVLAAFRDDRELVMEALEHNGMSLEVTSEELQNDREVVEKAVTTNGMALMFASPELRKDRALVMAAVGQEGLALQYASEDLRKDADVAAAAVANHGRAMLCIAPELREDRTFVLRAVADNNEALPFVPVDLRGDQDVLRCAVGQRRGAREAQIGAPRRCRVRARSRLE